MDFHSMPRRQLQTLCKQNRIPANITNVAMADALQALHAAGSLENAEEVIKDLTPLVPSSRKASLRRQAPASAADLEASIEPREQPASPLPRARRVTVKASEIRRLAVEGEENEKEEVEKEAVRGEATPRTVVKCSSMKPPPRSSRRATKKNDVEAKEEELVDAMKTPAPLTGRKTAARKLAKTPVAVEQEAAETVVSARVTTRRTTRQSTRATAEDSAKSIARRSSRIRSKTEESALKTGSSFQEVEPEQGTEIKNALVEEDNNGDKDCDLAVVDSDVPQNSLEEIVLAPEAKEFVTLPVVSEEKQLDKVEVDDHCENICTLVVIGDNIPTMHDLEEDRITPNTEELGAAKGEFMDTPTEEADVKELGTVAQQHLVSLQLHLFPKNDKEKPKDMITEKVDELDEIAPEDDEFTDVEELGSMVQHHEGGDTKDGCDRNEDEGIHGDQHRIVESGESDDNEDEVIQDELSIGEVLLETKCDFEGSPVQGLITSLENLEITKDGPKENEEDFAPQDDETKHAADEQTKETEEDFHLEDLAPEDDETKQEIPGVAVDSIIQNPASDITDCDNEVEIMTSDLEAKTTGEVIAVPKCQLSGADKETDDYSTKETEEDFHLEYLALEDYEAKQEIPGVSVDSIIQYHASDIPDCDYEVETMSSDLEAKTTDEVIAVTKCQLSGADKETDDYSTKETEEDFHLEYLALEDYEAKQEIPGVSVDSIIQYHASDIPDCDYEVETMSSDLEAKTTDEVIAVTKCQLSGADKETDDYSTKETEEDFHLEDLALEDYEAKQEIPGVSVDSIIQYHASDIPDCDNEVETMASDLEGKATGEVIAVTKCQLSGADKENDDDSAELFKDVVVNEDKKQNAQENLESMSLRKLKKMYKEKISNADKVKTKRQALNDVNQNIVL